MMGMLFTLTGCSDNTEFSTDAIIFTKTECPASKLALEFFQELNKKENRITYQIRDISIANNRILLEKMGKKYDISAQVVYTPVIFTDKGFTSGWGPETPSDLKILLNIR